MTNKLQDKYNKLFDKLKKEDELRDKEQEFKKVMFYLYLYIKKY